MSDRLEAKQGKTAKPKKIGGENRAPPAPTAFLIGGGPPGAITHFASA
jgi:hypothetical protein